MTLRIESLGGPLGAEVRGVQAGKPLAAADLAAIKQAFLEHKVLRFRGPAFTPRQLCDFSLNFGDIQPHFAKKYRLPDVPEVVLMINQDEKGNFDKVGAE
ncbi:MAG: TauD/TfdA dioxygenase family protein, partial [Burkholderiales bacterium]